MKMKFKASVVGIIIAVIIILILVNTNNDDSIIKEHEQKAIVVNKFVDDNGHHFVMRYTDEYYVVQVNSYIFKTYRENDSVNVYRTETASVTPK